MTDIAEAIGDSVRRDDGEEQDRFETAASLGVLGRPWCGHFVGRVREMAVLEARLEGALAGAGGLILVFGERGIGKSRLAEEAGSLARAKGARVLWGRCWEGEGAPPFWPWVQILRAQLKECDAGEVIRGLGSAATDVARLLPELCEPVPGVWPGTAGRAKRDQGFDVEGGRFRLFDGLTTLFKRAADCHPLVVTLDDLHWADQPSLVLLKFLAGEIREARILLIGTYRDGALDPGDALSTALVELMHHPWCERLALRGLSEEEVARFMARHPSRKPPDALVRAVYEKTEGNPFFINELVHYLAAEGRLDDPRCGEIGVTIPETVREVIRCRLAQLSPQCNSVLEIASVIGREFDLDILQASVSDLPVPQVLEAVGEAQRARVVIETPDALGCFHFAHVLIREALYDGISATRRARIHGKVGSVIEKLRHADLGPSLAALAYHLLKAGPTAGDPTRAVDYAVKAGRRASEQLAYEDAIAQYERALKALGLREEDSGRRCDLLLLLGEAENKAGRTGQARKTFLQAAAIARRIGHSRNFCEAALGFGWEIRTGIVDGELIGLLEEALALIGTGDDPVRVRLLSRLARALYWSDSRDRTAELTEEVFMGIAPRLNDATARAVALTTRYIALWGSNQREERLRVTEQLSRLAAENVNREMMLTAYRFQLINYLELGDIERARAVAELFSRSARELRETLLGVEAGVFQATLSLMAGQFDRVLKYAQPALGTGQRGRHPALVFSYWIQMFVLKDYQGGWDDLIGPVSILANEYPNLIVWRSALFNLWAKQGRPGAQFAELELSSVEGLPKDGTWLVSMVLHAESCMVLGDGEYARRLYPLLLPYAGVNVVVGFALACLGSVSHYLGLLARTLERWDDAVRHFEDALAMNTRLQAPPLIARTQHEFAQTLLSRGAAGDEARAAELLAAAITTYERLQMEGYLPKARELERRLRERIGAEADRVADAVVCESVPDLQGRSEVPERSLVSAAAQPPAGRLQRAECKEQIAAAWPKGLFRREGEYWSLGYRGSLVRMRDTRGLQYLGYLLRRPGQEVHAYDLATLVGAGGLDSYPQLGRRSLQDEHVRYLRCTNAGPMSDMKARLAYHKRLRELRDLIEEAEELNDCIKAGRLRNETEALIAEVSAAFGRDGSPRVAGSSAERARINVRNSIAAALKAIRRHDELLARHLWNAVRTGTFCSYVPETPVSWTF